MNEPLTKAMGRDLEWFAERESASSFGPSDPTLTMVRKLLKRAFVQTIGQDPGVFGFVRYAITEAGRAALEWGS